MYSSHLLRELARRSSLGEVSSTTKSGQIGENRRRSRSGQGLPALAASSRRRPARGSAVFGRVKPGGRVERDSRASSARFQYQSWPVMLAFRQPRVRSRGGHDDQLSIRRRVPAAGRDWPRRAARSPRRRHARRTPGGNRRAVICLDARDLRLVSGSALDRPAHTVISCVHWGRQSWPRPRVMTLSR